MSGDSIYPDTLPGPRSLTFQSAERRGLSTDPGPRQVQPKQLDRLGIESVEFVYSHDEVAVFVDWLDNAIGRAGAWFLANWPNPKGGALVRRFIGEPSYPQYFPAVGWRVTATCEVRGRGLNPFFYESASGVGTRTFLNAYLVDMVYADAYTAAVGGEYEVADYWFSSGSFFVFGDGGGVYMAEGIGSLAMSVNLPPWLYEIEVGTGCGRIGAAWQETGVPFDRNLNLSQLSGDEIYYQSDGQIIEFGSVRATVAPYGEGDFVAYYLNPNVFPGCTVFFLNGVQVYSSTNPGGSPAATVPAISR